MDFWYVTVSVEGPTTIAIASTDEIVLVFGAFYYNYITNEPSSNSEEYGDVCEKSFRPI